MTLDIEAAKTNIPLLDHQHDKYFTTVDRLMQQCKQEKTELKEVDEIVQQAQEYALDNFDTEEYLMELESYPDTEQHIAKHEQFKEKLDDCTSQMHAEGVDLGDAAKRLQALLVDWFNNQIKDDDMRLAAFLHARARKRKQASF